MGIFGALNTAVTGLRAQSYALENISGNIANSQTTGFKRVDTSFQDLIPELGARTQLAGSVLASSRSTNSVQGDIQNAAVGTFMAINGGGFFVVQKPSGLADNNPVFDGTSLFTRRGDFVPDKNGYLVNGAGYYLMGVPVDALTGNPIGSVPQVLQFQNDFLPASPTTAVEYRANLPKTPAIQAYDPDVADSELLAPADFTVNPLIAGTGTVVGDDLAAFMQQTTSGGAITVFDASGNAVNLQLRWAKAANGPDTWELFYQEDAEATGTEIAWRNVGTAYVFGADGKLDPPVANVTLTAPTINGVVLDDIVIAHGAGGITQFADASGRVQVNMIGQNGYAAGELIGISVNDKGRLTGLYSNGRTVDIAEITLASFNGPDMLRRVDGGAFAVTEGSGPPIFGAAGQVLSAALEGSNTDIADEFTKLIVTQQAYSANTRVVTTTNEMVRDLLNMLR